MSRFRLTCCASRVQGAGAKFESEFDTLLLEGFGRLSRQGHVKSDPSKIVRRRIEGSFGLTAQFSEEHFANKRKKHSSEDQSVVKAVDTDAFNFTKVDASEIISAVDVSRPKAPETSFFAGLLYDEVEEDQPDPPIRVTVLACGSPIAVGHVLLVPNIQEKLPQVINAQLLLCGLNLLAMSKRSDFRIMFNSWQGCSSVNHFHFHGLYMNNFNLSPSKRLAIENVDRSTVAGDRTEGKLCIELLAETQWYVRGFVLTAGCPPGGASKTVSETNLQPLPDLQTLARGAGHLLEELQRRNIAHNVLIAPFLADRRPAKLEDLIIKGEQAATAASPEIYIIPRHPERNLRPDAGFNAGICELSGVLAAHDEEHYNSFEEKSLIEIFKDVSLSGAEMDELICKVAWLGA